MHKIGDKVYCKKTNKTCISDYIKGETYVIDDIDIVTYDINIDIIYYVFILEEWFTIKYVSPYYDLFSDYFYTVRELRKLKLEKICIK
jgi:hypothetical protein